MAIEVYVPAPQNFELRPFQDRVLELVQLFQGSPVIRVRIVGMIAAGEPIEAIEDTRDVIAIKQPAVPVQHRHLVPLLREYLCPVLERMTADAFEIARVITPLLAGLALSGKVPIDLDPWLFAGIALMISRMGVAGFCAEHPATNTPVSVPPQEGIKQSGQRRGSRRRTRRR